ncbi:hypothetical protein CSIM01_09886 [Colletotrichum simmondsii]|uniref:Uncharacterized protein n=1 Tax=Colletotrichum simmondsii TaxID=703756 RepID=A0A135TDU2_9PEZI|nr:hypothetical protein CSIM01_09886 [Colletotrichum simmondsii]
MEAFDQRTGPQVSKRYVFPEQTDLSRRLPSYDALDPENILASCIPLLLFSHHFYIALCSNFALSRARRVTLYTGPVHSTDPFEPWTHYGTQLGPGISTELMLEQPDLKLSPEYIDGAMTAEICLEHG